jgi:hypothetical protein
MALSEMQGCLEGLFASMSIFHLKLLLQGYSTLQNNQQDVFTMINEPLACPLATELENGARSSEDGVISVK